MGAMARLRMLRDAAVLARDVWLMDRRYSKLRTLSRRKAMAIMPLRVYVRAEGDTVNAEGRSLSMPELVKVWRRAAELVDQGWCQGSMARDQYGDNIDVLSPRAVQWCYMGAVAKAVHEQIGSYVLSPLAMTLRTVWNDDDGRTAEQVSRRLRTEADLAETLLEDNDA
jgi:hypothetical protein